MVHLQLILRKDNIMNLISKRRFLNSKTIYKFNRIFIIQQIWIDSIIAADNIRGKKQYGLSFSVQSSYGLIVLIKEYRFRLINLVRRLFRNITIELMQPFDRLRFDELSCDFLYYFPRQANPVLMNQCMQKASCQHVVFRLAPKRRIPI